LGGSRSPAAIDMSLAEALCCPDFLRVAITTFIRTDT
jgi:hypothetical protein